MVLVMVGVCVGGLDERESEGGTKGREVVLVFPLGLVV